MNQFYDVTAISADEKELKRIATKYGVKNHHIEMTRTISPLDDLKAVWKLYRFLKKEKPELVHSHTPKAGIVGMMAAFLAGVPNRFHTVAGLPLLEATGTKRKVLNFVEKLTYSFATKVYPNSFGLNEIIIQEGFCQLEKLKVIGKGSSNGINTSYFDKTLFSESANQSLKEQLKIEADDFVFIFVGRLVGDKGINELIAAFKTLTSTALSDHLNLNLNLNRKLLLVGPYEQELDALKTDTLQEIEQNSNIISVGFQPDVRAYFAIANALVFPSYREGFPNVVLQAGAMGLPSIVSNINGCNEIIKDHQNGLIVPVKNTEALAEAMRDLVDDEILYQSLQHQSRKRIMENYEQEVVWQALLAEYKKVTDHV
ncbi:glycosyltransferase family 4 protein [Kaistella flava (ex Peng et al. 2021)]|uniref:Glycosyltransferase family 4 protein n=2 Tax=Kaistella flava (ex Peng et al. 2021) TaxID=2038776 RepID=A0A7M2YCH6_9FLAO|nr:glycosyltransferase family 4 protein [Kaistella flava (ex Peng et al. 2021)]